MCAADLSIDLEQLAIRESEQIEWKENVADVDDVVQTLSAFANDLANLGGGYVICGAQEVKDEHDFPKLVRVGLTSSRLKEVEGQVLQRCRDRVSPPISPLVHEMPSDDPSTRLLIFIQPSTGYAHSVRSGNDGAKHWVRMGRETREARNGTLRELLVRKGAQEPWDRRVCSAATVNDLDLLAIRDALQRMRVFSADRGVEAYLSDDVQLSAMVPPLCGREPMTNILRPRNFAILLFGREPQRFIPGMISLFSIYPGRDRSDVQAERHELAGTIIEQSRRLNELLDVQSFITFDKNDKVNPNSVKYPRRALYEAMGNALAHRDYGESDPTRVTVFEDRIEVLSPGGLPLGVGLEKFRHGEAAPRWRNQTLAWFFNRLQIAQAEGQGIPTILRTMREEGCPPPVFDVDEARVICVLPAHPRYAMMREIRSVEQDLAIGDWEEAQRSVTKILERDPGNARALQLFAEVLTSLRDPAPLVKWLKTDGNEWEHLSRDVLLQFSEALVSGKDTSDEYRAIAHRLLSRAASGRLEERELRRVIVAMIRSRDHRNAIQLLDGYAKEHNEVHYSASFHQLRGDALIGMANKCLATARRSKTPHATRERAWDQFEQYAREAKDHLLKALTMSPDANLISTIELNMSYLEEQKDKARRFRRPRR
ncbi:ATP-binding protein [Gluconacetobacter dulcium]|nr:ATP-binding protein [Gluconacetobacter dulcium]